MRVCSLLRLSCYVASIFLIRLIRNMDAFGIGVYIYIYTYIYTYIYIYIYI